MSKAEPRDAAHWRARAAVLKPEGLGVIGGRRVPAVSGATFECISPIDGRRLASVASGDVADIDAAVVAARAAFERGDWSQQPPAARKRVLQRFADLVQAHIEELALLETLDMGKPIRDSASAWTCRQRRARIRWYAEAIDKIYDEVAPTGPGALALITREPVGVVGAIVPWNFPMIMAAWKIGADPGGGQFAGAQALGEIAADGAAPGGAGAGGRRAARRVQRRARLRPHRRQGAGLAHGRRLHRLHRLDRHRQADHAVRRRSRT